MPAPIVRADYDHLTGSARSFSEQSALLRQTLQAISRQTDTLAGGDWLGQGAQAFYAEMHGQVLPTLNRLIRALEAAADTTHQINQVAQQAEAEAAAFFRLNGAGATDGAAAALGALGSGVGGVEASTAAVAANGAAFIGGKAAPGVTGGGTTATKRLGVTGSEMAKSQTDQDIVELEQHNPKLAEAIKKDPALRNLLERVEHAGHYVVTGEAVQGGLSVPRSTLTISPNTTVDQFKSMANDAVKNPAVLQKLDPRFADAIKKDRVLLERLLQVDERTPGFRLEVGKDAGHSLVRNSDGTAITLDPKNPAGSLSRALRTLERGDEGDWPISRRYPNHRDLFIREGVDDRLANDAAEIFAALRAQQVATGKMSDSLPHLGRTNNAASYQVVVEGYLNGSVTKGGAEELIRAMLRVEANHSTQRAAYAKMYAQRWAAHDAQVKAGAKQPASKTP